MRSTQLGIAHAQAVLTAKEGEKEAMQKKATDAQDALKRVLARTRGTEEGEDARNPGGRPAGGRPQ